MSRTYWLVKSEPESYSWEDFVEEGGGHWDGVRNAQARNNMRLMAVDDLVLFYHSGKRREVVGIARVTRESYQDPTTEDERWCVVDLRPVKAIRARVSLAAVREDALLSKTTLVRQSRLSVMPIAAEAFERFLEQGQTTVKKGDHPRALSVSEQRKRLGKS